MEPSDLERIVTAVEKAGRSAAELTALAMTEVAGLDPEEFAARQREWFRDTLRENLPDFGAPLKEYERLIFLGAAAFDERLSEALANQGQEGRA